MEWRGKIIAAYEDCTDGGAAAAAVADLKLAVIEIGGWPMRVEQAAAAEFKPPTLPPPLVRPTSEEAVLIGVDHDDSSGRCFWWYETHHSRADEGCIC